MPTYGLTTTGFLIPTIDEIRASINLDLINTFGASIDVNTGILARFVGILAERYALLWEQLEAVYNSTNPDAATGFSQDSLNFLRGSLRDEATYSTVTLTLTGVPTTIVPAGQQVSTKSNNGVNKFVTAASGTLVALPAWSNGATYASGARVTSGGNVFLCTATGVAGTAPSGTVIGVPVVDPSSGVLAWALLGVGTASVDVPGQSVLTGPIVGVAYDIVQIDQAIGNWSGVVNVLDAALGTNDQTDESFRLTSDAELSQSGMGTADAIRSALLEVTGVTAADVFVNNTDTTNSDGVPPHSIEALVQGGADTDIGALLLRQVYAGMGTIGNTTTFPTDSEGVAQQINFSRPVVYNVGVAVTLIKAPNVSSDTTTYPLDGDAQVKLAIANYGNTQKAGRNIVSSALMAQAFKVSGVLEVSSVLISSVLATSPGVPSPPTPTLSTTITISARQLAFYNTSWITVVSTDGTP